MFWSHFSPSDAIQNGRLDFKKFKKLCKYIWDVTSFRMMHAPLMNRAVLFYVSSLLDNMRESYIFAPNTVPNVIIPKSAAIW